MDSSMCLIDVSRKKAIEPLTNNNLNFQKFCNSLIFNGFEQDGTPKTFESSVSCKGRILTPPINK